MNNVIEILETIVNEEFFERHPIFQEKLEAEKALYDPRTYKRGNTCYPVSDPAERQRIQRRKARAKRKNPTIPYRHARAVELQDPRNKARKRLGTQKLINQGVIEYETEKKLNEEKKRLNSLLDLALITGNVFEAEYLRLELNIIG